MKIEWSPLFKKKLDVLSESDVKATGFVLGSQMGQILILEDILILPFQSKNLKDIYQIVSKKFGDKLKGILFFNRKIIKQLWMMENIFVHVQDSQFTLYHYTAEGSLKRLKSES